MNYNSNLIGIDYKKYIIWSNYKYKYIMEETMSAVSWLALRYHHRQGYLKQEDIKEAKEMEQQQIINTYKRGYIDGIGESQLINTITNEGNN